MLNRLTQPQRPLRRSVFLAIAAVVLALDQLTKWLTVAFLSAPAPDGTRIALEPLHVIPGVFALWYRENTGAAFSLFSEHTGLLALFSAAISLVFLVWAWRLPEREQGLRLPLALILGGAVGNLIDRTHLRYVIDMLHVHWQWTWHYPTFNIADSAVCVGMALLVIMTWRLPAPVKDPLPEPASPATPASGTKS